MPNTSEALYPSLDALAGGLEKIGRHDPAWWDKMIHMIAQKPAVERVPWLLARCKGKVVLHVGCDGPFDGLLRKQTMRCYGIDHTSMLGRPDFFCLDLDTMGCPLPQKEDVDIVLLAEILEHVINPGALLKRVKAQYDGRDILITTPNAFAPQPLLKNWQVMVNEDHTAWFCPQTLRVLIEKCGLVVQDWMYYGEPKPPLSEGLIFIVS